MRIIAGAAKGRRLRAPKGPKTRPMTDRVKEALFSILGGDVVDVDVLDLYAGSGSLGLEALSRGARHGVFVEHRGAAVAVLRANVAAVGLGGEIVVDRVERYVNGPEAPFGVVFVDPPYDLALPSVETVLVELGRWLVDDATVIVHRRWGSGEVSGGAGLAVADRRRYGDAEITRLAKEAKA